MSTSEQTSVLVTGATGFLGSHIVLQLLEAGYKVRGSGRSALGETELRHTLSKHTSKLENFDFFVANLEQDNGWDDAIKGCQYVMHVASPFPLKLPKHEDDLIVPARDGTLRVLQCAAKNAVKRVIMTSSIAAIVYGQPRNQLFTEDTWANVDGPGIGAYQKSKALAERAAWDFIENSKPEGMALTVINPGLILGPVLSKDYGTSGELIRKFMSKEIPAIPNMGWACVDVRDVAAAHIAAISEEKTSGQRLICANEHASMRDIAHILDKEFGHQYKIPTRSVPDFVVRFVALFDKDARITLNDLGVRQDLDNTKIKNILKWQTRSLEEMVVDMGKSLIEHGIV
jgi:dihydroflavonol-4-reductase